MTALQMMVLTVFCFLAMSFLVARPISLKENKNHFIVNISHCFLHPGPKDREESRTGREAED